MSPRRRIQGENRRRTGCHQCKDKHVRCTEEEPRCRRCERLNLKCERGLKLMYEEDALQRGISFGRQGTRSRKRNEDPIPPPSNAGDRFYALPLDQYIGRWIFLNTMHSDFTGDRHRPQEENADEICHGKRFKNMAFFTTQLSTTSLGHPLAAYSKQDAYLLEYFIQGIGPHCALSPNNNPYLSLITPLSFVSLPLRNALLAVSGNQLRLIGDDRFAKEALVYKSRAINSLHQAISLGQVDDGVIATVLMLCFHDISDGCNPSWVTHLRAGLELLKHTSATSCESMSLLKFFTMYFVAHDIMGRTASQHSCLESQSYDWTENDDLDEIDVIMGCSRRLMNLINEISNLAAQRPPYAEFEKHHKGVIEYNAKVMRLKSSIGAMEQKLPEHSVGCDNLARIAEVKRLATMLFLIERLEIVVSPLEKSKAHLNSDQPKQLSSRSFKRHLISNTIRLISSLPDSATLLWPLFVLGNARMENEEHRRFILDRLNRMQMTRNLGSVRRATVAVKQAFQRVNRDCGESGFDQDTVGFISLA